MPQNQHLDCFSLILIKYLNLQMLQLKLQLAEFVFNCFIIQPEMKRDAPR